MAMPLMYHRFTVDEYHRMAEAGILTEDDRVELLDGQIVAMTPIGPPHAGCVTQLTRLLVRALGDDATVSVQNPVVLGTHWEPEPDVAVLTLGADAYRARHPRAGDVLLLIEVADRSTTTDRRVKLPAYAAAGIPEVWLADLGADRVELFRAPTPGGYATVRTADRGDTVTPLALAGVSLRVDDILGPRG